VRTLCCGVVTQGVQAEQMLLGSGHAVVVVLVVVGGGVVVVVVVGGCVVVVLVLVVVVVGGAQQTGEHQGDGVNGTGSPTTQAPCSSMTALWSVQDN
jgi:hypothetical protein